MFISFLYSMQCSLPAGTCRYPYGLVNFSTAKSRTSAASAVYVSTLRLNLSVKVSGLKFLQGKKTARMYNALCLCCVRLLRFLTSESYTTVECRAVAMQRPRDRLNTRVVSGQRLGKHVPAATDKNATEEQCFLRGPC
jgi:hypothetical protein